MANFKARIAMNIRAYGFIEVQGDTVEEAIASITDEYVADNFEPHGSSDDLDYTTPNGICITEIDNEEGDEVWGEYQEVPSRWSDTTTATIWTVTTNDDSGAPDASVYTTAEDAEEAANDWVDGYWTQSEGRQLFPMITKFSAKYEWLCENDSDFRDSCIVSEHEVTVTG